MIHSNNIMERAGTVGNAQSPLTVLPRSTCEKIEKAIALTQDLVPAETVMEELGTNKPGLRKLIFRKKITRKMYTIAVNGKKFFYNKMILGIKKVKRAA